MRRGLLLTLILISPAAAEETPPGRVTSVEAGTRAAGVKGLSEDRSEGATLTLWAALLDPEESVREAAVETLLLRHGPEALTVFAQASRDDDPARRRSGILGLRRMGPLASNALSEFSRALQDVEEGVQEDALLALSHLGPRVASALAHPIGALTTHPKAEIRIGALRLLARLGVAAHAPLQQLGGPLSRESDSAVRREILLALHELWEAEAQPWLEWGAHDGSPEVRATALSLISWNAERGVGDRRVWHANRALLTALTAAAGSDPDPGARQTALRGLAPLIPQIGQFGRGLPFLQRLYDAEQNPAVRRTLLEVLSGLGRQARSHLAILAAAVGRETGEGRLLAIDTLGEIGPALPLDAIHLLWEVLGDPDPAVRLRTVQALGMSATPLALPPLYAASRDAAPEVRQAAARAKPVLLTGIADLAFPATPDLVSEKHFFRNMGYQLRTADAHMREVAAASLRQAKDRGWPVFRDALKDPRAEVRVTAAASLGLLGLIEARPAVTALVKDADPGVRCAAVWALTGFKKTPELLSAIRGRLDDAKPWVARYARLALDALGERAAGPPVKSSPRPPAKRP